MSIRVMSRVWDDFPGGGSELLALLALADWSDDEGRCYPSIAAIAKKSRLSRSQAQRLVHSLIDQGFVAVTDNINGGAPGSTRKYKIVLERLTGRVDATPTGRTGSTGSAHATGRTNALDGSHPCGETGSTHATQTVIEPSITVKRESVPAAPVTVDKSQHKGSAARLSLDFEFPEAWRTWCVKSRPEVLDPVSVFRKFVALYANAESKTIDDWFFKFKGFLMSERIAAAGGQSATLASDPDTKANVEAEGVAKGIGKWDNSREQWNQYKARVRAAALPTISFGAPRTRADELGRSMQGRNAA